MSNNINYIYSVFSQLPMDQRYFQLRLTYVSGYEVTHWLNFYEDIKNARLNLIFLTAEEAQETKRFIIQYLHSNKEKFNYVEEEPRDGKYVWIAEIFDRDLTWAIRYNSSLDTHREAFKNHFLFKTKEEAVKASEIILQILRRRAAENHFKPLIQTPPDNTVVYLADITAKEGYKSITYTKEFEHLLNDRLLFSNASEAAMASNAMKQLVKPPIALEN